jgi:hypothetical protein
VGGLIFSELRGAGYLSSFALAGAERLPVFPYSAFMLTDRDVAIFAELRGADYLSSFASAGAKRLPVFP